MRSARLAPSVSPLGCQLPLRGRQVGAPEHLPPPQGEVDERSEAGGGLVLFEIAFILQPPQSALRAASSPQGGAKWVRQSTCLPPQGEVAERSEVGGGHVSVSNRALSSFHSFRRFSASRSSSSARWLSI